MEGRLHESFVKSHSATTPDKASHLKKYWLVTIEITACLTLNQKGGVDLL